MKRIEREVIKVEYEAKDGKIFSSEQECKKYDRKCWLEKQAAIKIRLKGETFEGRIGYLYCIQNEEDFRCVKSYTESCSSIYEFCGPGWYICYHDRATDDIYLENYQDYLSSYKENFERVAALNFSLIEKAEKELCKKEE